MDGDKVNLPEERLIRSSRYSSGENFFKGNMKLNKGGMIDSNSDV